MEFTLLTETPRAAVVGGEEDAEGGLDRGVEEDAKVRVEIGYPPRAAIETIGKHIKRVLLFNRLL